MIKLKAILGINSLKVMLRLIVIFKTVKTASLQCLIIILMGLKVLCKKVKDIKKIKETIKNKEQKLERPKKVFHQIEREVSLIIYRHF